MRKEICSRVWDNAEHIDTMRISTGYTFDDVLLVPKHSNIVSRQMIDTSIYLGKNITLRIPIVSANMKHVTGVEMARTIASLGGLALLHRFDNYNTVLNNYLEATREGTEFINFIGASVGIKDKDKILY